MGQPAAKQGDRINAMDTHIVVTPAGSTAPMVFPFSAIISGSLSTNVNVMGLPAATQGSTGDNMPPHVVPVTPPGLVFQTPPRNRAQIVSGSARVMINERPAARNGDKALTCNDPVDLPVGTIVATGTVNMG